MTSLLPSIPVEKLSLSTFEPSLAQPPYLTTPRSLEACRLNGVNPIELVEVSMDEFRKDFPNDPDAAQRRYGRIDGARKRILQQVIADWKRLKEIGWKPKVERPYSAKETIIPVAAEAHCELLEIQAEKFRKIERDQMDALKRMLNMEIKHAVQESKNKQVLGKHEAIAEANEQQRKMRAQMREELHSEHVERMRQKEEEEMREIKAGQKMEAEYSITKQKKAVQDAKIAKKRREALEFRRQQQLAAIKQKKGIFSCISDIDIDKCVA